MFHRRETVSVHTIERAIRARLVVEHGVGSPHTVLPLSITPAEPDADGRNWRLDLPPATGSPEALAAVQIAVAHVASKLNLGSS